MTPRSGLRADHRRAPPLCRPCLALAACIAVVLANALFLTASYLTVRYQSSADILFAPTTGEAVRGSLFDAAPPTQDLSHHLAELRSPVRLDALVETLNLDTYAEFRDDSLRGWLKSWRDDPTTQRNRTPAIRHARDQLSSALVIAETDNSAIRITFEAADPELATTVANTAADQYAASLQQAPVPDPDSDFAELDSQIITAEAAVQKAQRAVDTESARATKAAAGQAVADDESARLAEVLSQMESERQQAEARASTARATIAAGRGDTLVDERVSPLTRQLTQTRDSLRDQLSRMSKTLPAHHPRLQELSADLSGIDHQLAAQAVQLVEKLEQSVAEAKVREAEMRRKLKAAKSRGAQRAGGALDELKHELFERRATVKALRAQRDAAAQAAGAAPRPEPKPAAIVVPATEATPILGVGFFANGVLSVLVALGAAVLTYRLAERNHRAH